MAKSSSQCRSWQRMISWHFSQKSGHPSVQYCKTTAILKCGYRHWYEHKTFIWNKSSKSCHITTDAGAESCWHKIIMNRMFTWRTRFWNVTKFSILHPPVSPGISPLCPVNFPPPCPESWSYPGSMSIYCPIQTINHNPSVRPYPGSPPRWWPVSVSPCRVLVHNKLYYLNSKLVWQ